MRTLFFLFAFLLIVCMSTLRAQPDFWQQVSHPYNGDIRSITFAPSGVMIAGTAGGGAWRSTDLGDTWVAAQSGMPDYYIYSLVTSPNGNIIAGSASSIVQSTNAGLSWTVLTPFASEIRVVAVSRTTPWTGTIFVGTVSGVVRSTDGGTTWSSHQLSGLAPIRAIAVDPSGNVFVATNNGGIYKSIDNGTVWFLTSLGTGAFNTIAVNTSGHVFAGTSGLVYRTTNGGASWEPASVAAGDVRHLLITTNGDLFAALTNGGIYRSTNNGTIWTATNSGINGPAAWLLASNQLDYLFAVVNASLYRSTSPVNDVDFHSAGVPTEFTLLQNYPNPFNPSTLIRYTIPLSRPGRVTLRIYDLLGREVQTLVDEAAEAGEYSAAWNGSGFSTGMYTYRLTSGEQIISRKMLLVR